MATTISFVTRISLVRMNDIICSKCLSWSENSGWFPLFTIRFCLFLMSVFCPSRRSSGYFVNTIDLVLSGKSCQDFGHAAVLSFNNLARCWSLLSIYYCLCVQEPLLSECPKLVSSAFLQTFNWPIFNVFNSQKLDLYWVYLIHPKTSWQFPFQNLKQRPASC